MKILLVSQYFHPEPSRANDLACWLVEQGHEVHVLTGQPNYPSGRCYLGYVWFRWMRERWRGIRIHRVPMVPRGNGGRIALSVNYLSFSVSGMLSALFACRRSYDVILCVTPSPITAALPGIVVRLARRIPLAIWVQDIWPESIQSVGVTDSRFVLFLIGRIVRFIYRRSDRILIASREFRGAVERYGVAPGAIAYLPNSADAAYRTGVVAPPSPPLPNGFRILYAGNIGEAQGLETLLAAAQAIPLERRISWIVVGDGRRRNWLLNEVGRRRLGAVTVLERVPSEDLLGLLDASDATVVLLRDDPVLNSAIPSKIQSCLAAGKPILAALAGEGAKIVRESGGGVVCKPGDGPALAAAAIALSEMPAGELAKLGAAGRSYYDANFARDLVYGDMLRQIASLRHGPASH